MKDVFINPEMNKIDAIKALSQFTADRFGHPAGLKKSLDFINDYIEQVRAERQRDEAVKAFRAACSAAKQAGLYYSDVVGPFNEEF